MFGWNRISVSNRFIPTNMMWHYQAGPNSLHLIKKQDIKKSQMYFHRIQQRILHPSTYRGFYIPPTDKAYNANRAV
jgi:hypothetical protein